MFIPIFAHEESISRCKTKIWVNKIQFKAIFNICRAYIGNTVILRCTAQLRTSSMLAV